MKHQSLNLTMRHIHLFIHGNHSFISKGVCLLHCKICCSIDEKTFSFYYTSASGPIHYNVTWLTEHDPREDLYFLN